MSICKKYDCEKCQHFARCGGCEKHNGKYLGERQCICVRVIAEKGFEGYQETVKHIVDSVNALSIQGLHVDDVNVLPGAFLNLGYPLPNGETAKFLRDDLTYFANQVDIEEERYYGVVSDGSFLLVASYGNEGKDPKLVAYKAI